MSARAALLVSASAQNFQASFFPQLCPTGVIIGGIKEETFVFPLNCRSPSIDFTVYLVIFSVIK